MGSDLEVKVKVLVVSYAFGQYVDRPCEALAIYTAMDPDQSKVQPRIDQAALACCLHKPAQGIGGRPVF